MILQQFRNGFPVAILCSALGLLVSMGCDQTERSNPGQTDNGGSVGEVELKSVTLQLNWFPEAEHGGYYAALVHGFFEEEGLSVEILPGGPGSPVIQKLVANQVDFAVGNADQVLTGRNQEANVKALLAPIQMSPRCIMVHESAGIKTLDELQNMTLALSAGRAFALYMQKKLSLENVKVVGYPGSISVFLTEENFGQQGYVFSEPFIARQQGGDPHVLMVSDIGFNPYTSLLIADNDLIENDPDVVQAMIRASKKGWQHYLQSPEETNAHIHQCNEEMGLDILAYGAEILKDLCLPKDLPADRLGEMNIQRWLQLRDQLLEIELVDKNLDASAAFLP